MNQEIFNPEILTPNNSEKSPNLGNNPKSSVEKEGSFTRSLSRSKSVKHATKFVIHTRKDLQEFLAKQNIKLITSALEYQQTQDFIQSSYVVFEKYKDHQESLKEFLERYPQLKETVEQINQKLKKADTAKFLQVNISDEEEENPFTKFS